MTNTFDVNLVDNVWHERGVARALDPYRRVGQQERSRRGVHMELRVGQSVTFSLPSNPGSGYAWEAFLAPDAPLEVMITPEAPVGSLVGGEGRVQVCVHALRRGETLVALTQRRAWETDSPEAIYDSLAVRVSIT